MKKNQDITPAAPMPIPHPEIMKAESLLEQTPATVAAQHILAVDTTDTIGEAIAKTQQHIDKTAEEKLKRDREMVRGRFHYTERPGGELKFNFYTAKGDPEGPIKLKDGDMCTVMRKVAKHLNNSGRKPVYGWYKDANGIETQRIERYESRYYFENYDVFDLDQIGPNDHMNKISKQF